MTVVADHGDVVAYLSDETETIDVRMTPEQALALAHDLLSAAVRAACGKANP